ncbi:MAG TPA: DivIVA domain-containing protein [Pilimelia sp.]|nr:DivIVA domain-containing protein [Pilimelia sp.]
MTSQGQRFRRRALRRGYKVDEVDSFLDQVEATLAGDPIGTPVSAQDVHDVVFRVRFGGYDEWQVDLHLDRVERQLAEMEDRGGYGRPPERGVPERMGVPDRMGPPDRRPHPVGPPGGFDDRMGPPPMRDDRMGPPPMRDDRSGPPRPVSPMAAPVGPPPQQQEPYGRFDEPGYGAYDGPPARYDNPNGGYDGFEPGRHGKMDMTAEIRMPDRETMMGPGGPPMLPPGMPAPGMPAGGPPQAGPGGPQMGGGPVGPPSGDVQRVDMLRRTFQPRRFGSGYDPAQVDRLFESILSAMAGRGPLPANESELDTSRFNLVPGGYFEAEVDAALREVREILRRR